MLFDMSDVPERGPQDPPAFVPLSGTPRRAEAQAAWAAGRPLHLSSTEDLRRDPSTMPPGMLAHADQLQAEQAEFAPLLDKMSAEIRTGMERARPPLAAEDRGDIAFGPIEDV